jgi:hypothetical protein
MASRISALFVLSAVAALSACSDPVHKHQVDALGGEQPGVPAGPLHRPGQPCLACHGEYGPANSEFAFAGTIYADSIGKIPLPDAKVTFVDVKGNMHETGANCVGNFFIMKGDYKPEPPVWTTVIFGTMPGMMMEDVPISKDMTSPIYREGSCATCHADPPGVDAVGHVFLNEDPIPNLPESPSCH